MSDAAAPTLAGLLDDVEAWLGDLRLRAVPEERYEPVRETIRACRHRAGFVGRPVVAALIGGTGTGKSTILNGLARREISETGRVRPCTRTKVIWAHESSEACVRSLVAIHSGDEIVLHSDDRARDLVVIDLPDYDSVASEHRAEVDRILPQVDVAIWVVDPDKYSDEVLHEAYLRRLADYRDLFVFVFNRTDVIAGETEDPAEDPAVHRVVEHFRDELREDGLGRPTVFPVSALAAVERGPRAVEAGRWSELEDHLFEAVERKRARLRKVLLDLRAGLDDLGGALGAGEDGEGGPAREAARILDEGWADLASALGTDVVDPVFSADLPRALATDLRRQVRASVGGPLGWMVGLGSGPVGAGDDPFRARGVLSAWRSRARVNRLANRIAGLGDELRRALGPSSLRREIDARMPDPEAPARVTDAAAGRAADRIGEAIGGSGGRRRAVLWAILQLGLPGIVVGIGLTHLVRNMGNLFAGGSIWGALVLLFLLPAGILLVLALGLRIAATVRAARTVEEAATAFEERLREGMEEEVHEPLRGAIAEWSEAVERLEALRARTEEALEEVAEPARV